MKKSKDINLDYGKDSTFNFREIIKNPLKWTAETPNLYTLTYFFTKI